MIMVEEKRICKCCGAEFTANKAKVKLYCSIKCQHKACRKLQTEANEKNAIDMVARCGDEWEYVGGYTGSEGQMIVRHKPCGTEMSKSSQTVRKGRQLICKHCIDEAKAKRETIQKETRRFYQPVKKVKLQEMKECAVCGSFYFSSRTKYCSDECSRKAMNRYFTDRKEIKRKQARTKQSYEITVRSLYNRDSGICWICGGMCNINADGKSNDYPSIDHIIPVSLGGKDEWDNVRLAHRICNSLRGNKPVGISPVRKIKA